VAACSGVFDFFVTVQMYKDGKESEGCIVTYFPIFCILRFTYSSICIKIEDRKNIVARRIHMKEFIGKSVFSGIAIGKIAILKKDDQSVKRTHVEDTAGELARVNAAKEKAIEQLKALYEKAVKEVGEAGAMIFDVHQMMLDDQDYLDSITNMIETQNINAEYAVAVTGDNFSKMFAEMDDDYMKARAADVKDISERLIRVLQGSDGTELNAEGATIVVAEDLAPSETVQMDKSKVLAFVTRFGSSNSHTAILARTMNIPALIGVDYVEEIDGKMAVVDGFGGKLIVEPEEEVLEAYKARYEQEVEKRKLLQELKGKENVTKSGKKINIYANIGKVSDVANVLQNDAGGIGLFRSEFLYLEKDTFPTEDEQYQAYKQVAETMAGKKVIIRTLDIGADKQADYFGLDHEENPAMGYRAIRICLNQPDIFKTQLRALFRASIFGTIAIMYPMIISVNEVRKIKEIVAEVKKELDEEGLPYADVEQGIMIETPAAVMISDLLAKEVDFFSIGTNDLTQYTLAIDRQNAKLDNIYDSHHEAVLRMIKMVVDNAHKEGIWAGICGELGADTTLTEEFVRMGLDELSVTPTFVLPVRKVVREME
jgi:phosphotransferase system enzyme I (PtsI)